LSHRVVASVVKSELKDEKQFLGFFGICPNVGTKVLGRRAKEDNFLILDRMDAVVMWVDCAHGGSSNGVFKSCVCVKMVRVPNFEV